MLSRRRVRGIQVSPVLVASLAVLGGCSSEVHYGPTDRTVATAMDGDGAARTRLASIRDQVTMPRDLAPHAAALPIGPGDPEAQLESLVPVIGPGIASRFEAQPSGGTIPLFDDGAHRERRTRVELPSNASQPVLLDDPESGVGISFALEGAQPARRHEVDGIAMYLGVTEDGADVAHRAHAAGVEDYVYFAKRPSRSAVHYQVDVRKVPGLRFVENVLEFLNAQGDPRLRMKAPYVVGADGETHQPRVSVEGCAHDTSPAAPWDRAVTAPGSDSCLVTVAWDDAKTRYPAVLDPGWEATDSMTTARTTFTMINITSNRLLVAGGGTLANLSATTATAEIYNPSSNTFANTDSLDVARAGHTATLLATGSVVVTGGSTTGATCLDSAEVWNGSTWSTLVSKMKGGRRYHTATLLSNLNVLIVGGLTGTTSCNAPASTSEVYNSLSQTFATGTTPSLTGGVRAYHTATWVPWGAERVLVAGGENAAGASYQSAEIYTASTNAFTLVTDLSLGRSRHVAALSERGNTPCPGNECRVVLLAGGRSAGSAVDTIEYWGADNQFVTPSVTLPSPRYSFAAAVVDGPSSTKNVVFMGGRYDTGTRSDSMILKKGGISPFVSLDAGSLGAPVPIIRRRPSLTREARTTRPSCAVDTAAQCSTRAFGSWCRPTAQPATRSANAKASSVWTGCAARRRARRPLAWPVPPRRQAARAGCAPPWPREPTWTASVRWSRPPAASRPGSVPGRSSAPHRLASSTRTRPSVWRSIAPRRRRLGGRAAAERDCVVRPRPRTVVCTVVSR